MEIKGFRCGWEKMVKSLALNAFTHINVYSAMNNITEKE